VEITQKVPVWLRLSASDTPGHGSMPHATSAMTRIVEALNRLRVSPFPARIIPTVDTMFKGLATSMEEEWSDAYGDMATAVQAPGFLPALQARSPLYHALTRDTCSITRMGASDKINVVAPQAWAEIDCRMLPDRSSAEFIADVEALLAGTGVRLETILAFTPAVSTTDTDLFRAIETVAAKNHPGSRVIPGATPGFTDSHFFRDLGIVSYGFTGIVTPMSEFVRVHGNDERVSAEAIRDAVRDLFDVVSTVVYEE
jgi:acetylornithine deacetylase/succinyl-diaminopimelate desuccinylase-like protein